MEPAASTQPQQQQQPPGGASADPPRPLLRPEKDKDVSTLLSRVRSYDLYAPAGGDGAPPEFTQKNIPQAWHDLKEAFWKASSRIHRARAAAPAAGHGENAPAPGTPAAKEVRDWPAFLRDQLSADLIDTQYYVLHRADADHLGPNGAAKRDPKDRFHALTKAWGFGGKAHLFFVEYPGRGIATNSNALKSLCRLARAHSRAAIWAAVRDAMLARHGADVSVPVPTPADVKAAEARLNAQPADDGDGDYEPAGASPAQGSRANPPKRQRAPSGGGSGGPERPARRQRIERVSTAAGEEVGRRISASYMASEPSFLEMLGGARDDVSWGGPAGHGADGDPSEHDDAAAAAAAAEDAGEDAAQLESYRRLVEACLHMPEPSVRRHGLQVAYAMRAVRSAAYSAGIALDVQAEAGGYCYAAAAADGAGGSDEENRRRPGSGGGHESEATGAGADGGDGEGREDEAETEECDIYN